jgi:neutral trehalase
VTFAAPAPVAPDIKLNQLGFLPGAAKVAVVPATDATAFTVIDAAGAVVQRGALGAATAAPDSGETVKLADFSALTAPGRYRLRVAGLADSLPFEVAPGAYQGLNAGALRAYYFNRAGVALDPKHAGVYARAAGHADTSVLVHASAASTKRPAGTVLSSPKGWYDAGDYNKYIVNSGISTYTLLAAWEDFPAFYQQQTLNLPESGNGIPDILNEALWNLEWMLTMQDPNDGGVYHKLTDKNFDGYVMPAAAKQQRYVVQKTTAAALDFAAVMATASRVLAPYDKQLPGLAARTRTAAEGAWAWARANPAVYYRQPADIKTGEYGDRDVRDEFAWAAAELFITTGNAAYYQAMHAADVKATVPSWSEVNGLAWLSLARHRDRLGAVADRALIVRRIDELSARLAAVQQRSPYGTTMQTADYVWGSNAVVLNQAMVLVHGYRLTGKRAYLDAAQADLDYILGRNATDLSFVTGFGARAALHPHHRPSEADGIAAPVPGWLVGGPQPGQQDAKDCPVAYASKLPARSYLDHACSYASNEIAINWNAPLVYVSAALQVLTPQLTAPVAPQDVPTPQQLFGPLYEAVQTAHIYPDAKTFADAVPRSEPATILARYQHERPQDKAALQAFVERHFDLPAPAAITLRQHIASLWPVLTRPPLDPPKWSSALPLPANYVVPGGRFREIYYWDSYFTMLGLRADHRDDLVDSMLIGFQSLIERYGHIPNGTRSYYLSRSQPPFFAAMAQLKPLGNAVEDARLLAALQREHAYWMRGAACLPKTGPGACEHVVRLADGTILNRYWDAKDTPRDEATEPDLATARDMGTDTKRPAPELYRDLRAAAESGWDFSSRWQDDPQRLATVHTTSIVPVDLNSLMYQLEGEVARRCAAAHDTACTTQFRQAQTTRAAAIERTFWVDADQRYADYDLRHGRPTPVLSAATLYPLWVGIATPARAAAVAASTQRQLLAEGGLRTTLLRTGQQWDAPNGWAPLQWIAVDGLARYGHTALARDIAGRWVSTVHRTWQETGKLLEKYDVEERKSGGGGEYPTQDGFGWTNGVTSALLERYPELNPP